MIIETKSIECMNKRDGKNTSLRDIVTAEVIDARS